MNSTDYIQKRKLRSFVNHLSDNMKSEFCRIIGRVEISTDKVFEPYAIPVKHKAFMGRFHRTFVQKVICNLQDKDWYGSKKIFKFASIFPFPIKPQIDVEMDLEIYQALDSSFKNEIRLFLEKHFDNMDQVQTDKDIDLFLKNILLFQTAKNNDDESSTSRGENVCTNILNDIPQLTEKTVNGYLNHYQLARKVMKKFSPRQEESINFEEYDESYFRNLPETNFMQLFSLLDVDFYRQDPARYTELFEKYLFFFKHALCLGYTPLCFIDDLLFKCLEDFHFFVKSRQNPVDLKPQIANHTCIYERSDIHRIRNNTLEVSDESLNEIKNFVEKRIRKIEKTNFYENLENAPLSGHVFACTDHELFDVCFSRMDQSHPYFFIKLILFSVLSPRVFNRISIYNLYTGQKTWMYTPSCDKDKVLKFIDEYIQARNKAETVPENYITKSHEGYFEAYMPK